MAVPPRLAVREDERVPAITAKLRVVTADLVEAEGLEGVVEERLPREPLAGIEVEQVTAGDAVEPRQDDPVEQSPRSEHRAERRPPPLESPRDLAAVVDGRRSGVQRR